MRLREHIERGVREQVEDREESVTYTQDSLWKTDKVVGFHMQIHSICSSIKYHTHIGVGTDL